MSMRNIWFGCALGLVGLQIAAAQKKAPEKRRVLRRLPSAAEAGVPTSGETR